MRRRQINQLRAAGVLPPVAAHERERWAESSVAERGRETAPLRFAKPDHSEMPSSVEAELGGGGGGMASQPLSAVSPPAVGPLHHPSDGPPPPLRGGGSGPRRPRKRRTAKKPKRPS